MIILILFVNKVEADRNVNRGNDEKINQIQNH